MIDPLLQQRHAEGRSSPKILRVWNREEPTFARTNPDDTTGPLYQCALVVVSNPNEAQLKQPVTLATMKRLERSNLAASLSTEHWRRKQRRSLATQSRKSRSNLAAGLSTKHQRWKQRRPLATQYHPYINSKRAAYKCRKRVAVRP